MVVKASATTEATVESDAGGLFSWGAEAEPTAVTVTADVAEAAEQQPQPEEQQPTAEPQPDQEPELILPPVVHVKRRSDGEFAIVDLTGKTRAELDHEDRINALSRKLAQACVDESRAVAAAKWAKEVREGHLAALQQAIAEGPEYPQSEAETGFVPEEACVATPFVSEGAGGETPTPAAVTTSPSSPASDQAAYDALLRSAKLADLTLTRDGKKVSLKGTVEKLDAAGVRTIYDWEQLRSAVSTNRPGAEYPPRIRRNDLEEAVAGWILKNSLAGMKPQQKAEPSKAESPQQPIPVPAVAQDAPKAATPDSQAIEPTKPVDAKPEAKAAEPKKPTAADILGSQSLLALAMPRPVVEALEADGITTLAKLKMVVDANTFSPKFNDGDRKRIAQRLANWMAETLPTML